LLERLRRSPEPDSWARFVQLYAPLIYSWARRANVPHQEAADLVQDVLTLLVEKLPNFVYDRNKSFRRWLQAVTLNKWREHCRRRDPITLPAATGLLEALAGREDGLAFEEQEYRQYLVNRALQVMKADFQPITWKACWEHVVSGRSAAEVATSLGISEGAVYVAKHRVLRRLREELQDLLD
jgi:RNA polymerase sigma-70 factor (ECF subfamily)